MGNRRVCNCDREGCEVHGIVVHHGLLAFLGSHRAAKTRIEQQAMQFNEHQHAR